MTEHDAIELIPWFLNGTLEGAERAEVADWIERSDTVRDELARWKAAWRLHAATPSGEDLVAYVEGTLDPETTRHLERLRDASPATRDLLAMLEEGREAGAGDDEAGETEVLPFRPRTRREDRRSDRRRGRGFALPLAAALVSAAFTSLLWWSAGPATQEPTAIANIALVELLPSDTRVRGDAARPVQIGQSDQFLVLLASDHFQPASNLRLRLLDAEGTVRASLEGVERTPEGTMSVLLTRPDGPGPYEIVVSTLSGKEIERFRMDLGEEAEAGPAPETPGLP